MATNIRSIACVISTLWGIGVFDVARNMDTSVQVIQNYYGKHATPRKLATQLGGNEFASPGIRFSRVP